jgi:hypothetical protein
VFRIILIKYPGIPVMPTHGNRIIGIFIPARAELFPPQKTSLNSAKTALIP